ncbi:MAG: sugar ABC transporter ATP-binding protein [Granulosicoccus sp.]
MHHSDGLFFNRICKKFGGTQALDTVSLHIERGEIVALLGENGAGKSTLIKCLSGLYAPDSGQILIDGVDYRHTASALQISPKVSFIHQDLGLIEWMSIAENIAMAIGFERSGPLISWRRTEAIAARALKLIDSDFDPSTRVSSLSRTEKSLVAIARALVVDSEFLVLDEPTASLPADEVERLFNALRPLKDKGVGMIYVSHRLDEIFRVADRVAVLRDGKMVGVRNIEHTSPEELVTLIVGKKAREIKKTQLEAGRQVLRLQRFATDRVGQVNLELARGEMLGLVGLRGAGHEDIGRALYGLKVHTGEISIEGQRVSLHNPIQAIDQGIGFIAGDRIVESIAPSLSIRENAFLNPMIRGRGMFQLQSADREATQALELGTLVGLSPNDPTLAIEALSGGNQQKIVVGRWLDTRRSILIAEDPTAGVDVGAKAEIYQLLFDATVSGMGVLVVSTDFEEVANVCHRALVFSRGLVVAQLSGVELSPENLIHQASAGETSVTSEKTSHAIG